MMDLPSGQASGGAGAGVPHHQGIWRCLDQIGQKQVLTATQAPALLQGFMPSARG